MHFLQTAILTFTSASILGITVTVSLSLVLHSLIFRTVSEGARPSFLSLGAQSDFLTFAFFGWLLAHVAIAWALTGRPIYGLVGFLSLPIFLPLALKGFREREEKKLGSSALSFLYALRGLIGAGLSLPAALFQLSERMKATFSEALDHSLKSFDEGRSLETCLSRFRLKSNLKVTGTCLALLEMTYRNGLSVLPLLDRMIPFLESEKSTTERIWSLRKSALAQIFVAFLVPWILWWVLGAFQPELRESFLTHHWGLALLAGILGYEVIGVVLVWRISCFY